MNIVEIVAYFFIYAFLGWVCEDIYCGVPAKKFINRGFLYGPYCPIYGFGAILVLYPLEKVREYPVLVFILGIIITSTLEYFASYIMEAIFHMRWWDYSQYKFNIKGRVCLLNAILFGLLSLVAIYFIHPFIKSRVEAIPSHILTIIVGLASIGFVMDLFFTVKNLFMQKRIYEKAYAAYATLKERFEADKEAHKESLHEWAKHEPEYEALKELKDKVKANVKTHLSKAYPKRELRGPFGAIQHIIQEAREELGK